MSKWDQFKRDNPEVVDEIYAQGCLIAREPALNRKDKCCQGVDIDHVSTRGSWADNAMKNLMPLCRKHHTEKGQIGYSGMIKKYRVYGNWLRAWNRHDIFDRAGLPAEYRLAFF